MKPPFTLTGWIPKGAPFSRRAKKEADAPNLEAIEDAEAPPPMPEGPSPFAEKPQLISLSKSTIAAGAVVVGVFFVGFGGWAMTAPLSSAAIAPGVISPNGYRRTVQHLEGGIIADILVEDGDTVRAGDPLVVLDDVRAQANYEVIRNQTFTNLAIQARLLAELAGDVEIGFPAQVRAAMNRPQVADVVTAQSNLFDARRESRTKQIEILQARIRQLDEQIIGFEEEIASQDRQISILDEQIADQQQLCDKELCLKSNLLGLQRLQAEVEGERARNRAAIAQARQSIGETELQIAAVDTERLDEINTQLTQVRGELAELEERLIVGEDTVKRTIIAAPIDGTVVNLRYKTLGGVIRAGEPIVDVVPDDEELLIDARVSPVDIDNVKPGLKASVVFSAFKQRNIGRIEGVVRTVSADALVDENTGMSYFAARIEVDDEVVKRQLPPDAELTPGMPAEAFIMTGDGTVFSYLMDPVTGTLRRAMREF